MSALREQKADNTEVNITVPRSFVPSLLLCYLGLPSEKCSLLIQVLSGGVQHSDFLFFFSSYFYFSKISQTASWSVD